MTRSLLERILRMLENVASLILFLMMMLTFVDVIFRYVLSEPIFGSTEMVRVMLALIIFLGLGVANARDKHIVVELFDQRLRSISPRAYDLLVQGFSVVAMLLIVYVLYRQAAEAAHTGATTLVLDWPLSWIIGIITGLAVLSVVSQILGLIVGRTESPPHHLENF